jgi:hypothetical protein
MLNIKTVRERLNKTPFKPFYIRLTDGRRVYVEHPDFVSVGGSVVAIISLDDSIQEIDSLHIVSLDPAPAKRRNGKHSR